MGLNINDKDLTKLKELCKRNKEATLFIYELEKKRLNKANKRQRQKLAKREAVKKALEDRANKFREDLIKKQTDSEKRFKIFLNRIGVKYEFQKIIFYDSSFYIVDFYLPSRKIVFEIDGGYHNSKEQKSKDNKRTGIIKNYGVKKVYRFTNEETTNTSECVSRLKHILSRV